MRIDSKNAIVSGIVLGFIVTALTALTDTGATGFYAFMILGLLVLGISLMWPERRRFRHLPS